MKAEGKAGNLCKVVREALSGEEGPEPHFPHLVNAFIILVWPRLGAAP